MSAGLKYCHLAPIGIEQMTTMEQCLTAESGSEVRVLASVRLRASQINRYEYCTALQTLELLKLKQQQEDSTGAVSGIRIPGVFTAPERVALAWTEAWTGHPASFGRRSYTGSPIDI